MCYTGVTYSSLWYVPRLTSSVRLSRLLKDLVSIDVVFQSGKLTQFWNSFPGTEIHSLFLVHWNGELTYYVIRSNFSLKQSRAFVRV